MTKTKGSWQVDVWCNLAKDNIKIRVNTGIYTTSSTDSGENIYTIRIENVDTYQELEIELSASQAKELVKRIIAAPLEDFGDRFGRWVFRQTVKKRVFNDN